MILPRLAQLDCWLVVALGQTERHYGQLDALQFRFCFCCSMRDAGKEEAFFDRFAPNFWRKGAPTVDLEKYCWYLFLHE
jgi:hypothetical protein